jgi:hypothetical protein
MYACVRVFKAGKSKQELTRTFFKSGIVELD